MRVVVSVVLGFGRVPESPGRSEATAAGARTRSADSLGVPWSLRADSLVTGLHVTST